MIKESRLLRVGVLGCGPVAQAAHFDACRKARNAELYAICDVADDLRERMAAVHQPRVAYGSYDDMLSDSRVEAVVVAVADEFHVPAALKALAAGKHVLVEKPLGTAVEECRLLCDLARVRARRPGREQPPLRPGGRVRPAVHRRGTGRANLAQVLVSRFHIPVHHDRQPPAARVPSAAALRPSGDPRADRRRYYLLTHGSHLVDMARWLGGNIKAVRARSIERCGALCWFVSVDYADGGLGHLDLQVPVRGDFQEGFQVFGEHGSLTGRVHLPWFHKASEVECFSTRDGLFRRPLGEDAHTYKRQIEGLADTVLHGIATDGAGPDDGLAAVQALVAIARSAESASLVQPDDVSGGV